MSTARALVLSPAMPWWDGGAAVAPLVDALASEGVAADVLDTSALALAHGTLTEVVDGTAQEVDLDRYAIFVGNALGGTVALLLAACHRPDTPVLSVSGPARTAGTLTDRLAHIVDAARTGDIDTAVEILHRLVMPIGKEREGPNSRPGGDRETGARRLARSLHLLLDIDVIEMLREPGVRAVTMIGGRSQLVREPNALHSPTAAVVHVEEAGMRVHLERPDTVAAPLRRLLRQEAAA
ncbi:alpha/beta fold hydrolase [Microbacterium lacticum]